MLEHDWGVLLPDQVGGLINFDRSDPDWNYEQTSTSMASRQAEGVAYLWNLLAMHGVALLADEVGMGKTFQALGVAALLWKMKPDAKVLVMAPNGDICKHWQREYDAFVRFHYRAVDHCVKNDVDGGPVQSILSCGRLEELAETVESGAGNLFLTKISSLSGLVPMDEKGGDNITIAKANACKIHERIKQALGGDGFDLIIIDEAHYFRNKSGDSQRVHAAESFFGDPSCPLADKVLLLTATPSHTNINDVNNILSYFLNMDMESDKSALALMQRYALRRFRRMQGHGGYFSKREYRHEKSLPCGFETRPESEMFFALYQKMLVTELGLTRNNKSMLYGFLEGFESVGREGSWDGDRDDEEEKDSDDSKKDFSRAPDTKLLARLTGQFSNSFGELPDHPKYGQIVDLCVPDDLFSTPRNLHEDKHLVFVRRIPSVRELTQRINYAYDASLAGRIYGAWGLEADDPAVKKWRATSWSRKGFIELVLSRQSGEDEEDEIEGEELSGSNEDGDAYLGSTIGDLFVVKKERNNRTDCSNVSLRFRKAESAFAMFLEPSSDYLMEGYDVFEEYERGGKVRADYVNAAQEVRLRRHELFTQKAESVQRERQTKNYEKKVSTVWSMVYPELSVQQQDKIRDWSTNRPDVAENFSNYIKTGFLFASPVMVELYAWFTEFNLGPKVVDVQEKYSQFMKFVAPRIRDSLLLCYFKSALDTFEILCEKIIDHKLGEWEKDWRVLTSLQNPAWYASGQTTNRQRLILGFNSPFYPNVLVATSVFQEGVNLHLQCTKVHHYGIAGSPGDNEQRVGRVDRLFGKVNELLKVDGLAELEINYPFLKNSFDEDQVASFIARKFHIEEKMDACTQSSFDKVVELTQGDWEQFLRKPGKAIVVKDPYGAKFDKLPLGITYRPFESHASANVANHIASLFEEGLDPSIERLFVVGKNQHNPNAMLMIDPVVEHNNGQRRQPVLVEQHFSAEFSALVSGTVYYVSLTSPLASKEFLGTIDSDLCNKLASIGQEGSERYPLVRMAIDPNLAVSHFYLHVRVDLPLFVRAGSLVMLSREELMAAFNQLKDFSDRAEYELFSGERDLALDELRLAQFLTEREPLLSNTKPNHLMTTHSDRWEMVQCSVGLIERLSGYIKRNKFKEIQLDAAWPNQGDVALLSALVLNSDTPFVSFWPADTDLFKATIGYPSGDIQLEERELLERWFDYVMKRGGSDG